MTGPADDARRSIRLEMEVAGTPEEVWEAIATGPGISSWLQPTQVDPETGEFSFDMGSGEERTGRITAWEPPRRFAQETGWEAPGGESSTLASEWIIEAHSGGTCVVRLVVSGFGSGGSWDDELEGFGASMAQALLNLRTYTRNFRGRNGRSLMAFGAAEGSPGEAFRALTGAVGLEGAGEGARVDAAAHGAPVLAGIVEEVTPGSWRRDMVLLLEQPAEGFGVLSAYGTPPWTSVTAYLFGDDAADIATREQPRWEAWMHERFPGNHPR